MEHGGNPEIDIFYVDSDFHLSWGLARRDLFNSGYNSTIKRIAIDWRLCLTTLTPRRSNADVLTGRYFQDGDWEFTLLIISLLGGYPSIKSVCIFFPKIQHKNIFHASESSAKKTNPIAGLTDIVDQGILLGDGIGRLRTCLEKLSTPHFRHFGLGMMSDYNVAWRTRSSDENVSDLEIRQFILHRDRNEDCHWCFLDSSTYLPRPDLGEWPTHVPQ